MNRDKHNLYDVVYYKLPEGGARIIKNRFGPNIDISQEVLAIIEGLDGGVENLLKINEPPYFEQINLPLHKIKIIDYGRPNSYHCREATQEEIEEAVDLFDRGFCDHKLYYVAPGVPYDAINCAICGTNLEIC